MSKGTTSLRPGTVPTRSLGGRRTVGDLTGAVGELYASAGLSRPVVLEANSPERLVHTAHILEGLRFAQGILPAMALLTASIGLLALWSSPTAGTTAAAVPALLATLIAPVQVPHPHTGLSGRAAALVPWTAWAVAGVVGAGTWVRTGNLVEALLAAAWAGAGVAAAQAAGTLLAGLYSRWQLCWRHAGLRRALGWRGLMFGAKPAANEVARALGWGLAQVHDPLRGVLGRHGQPRVRRHLECNGRIEHVRQAGWQLQVPTASGLGPGLPNALSLWPLAREEAALARTWLDLPHDGQGAAAWESGTVVQQTLDGEAALRAAQAVEVLADVAWLLRGVAVALPAPTGG